MNESDASRIEELAARHIEGALTDDDVAELRAAIESSPEAFELFCETMDVHVELGNALASIDGVRSRGRVGAGSVRRVARHAAAVAVAAGIALAAYLGVGMLAGGNAEAPASYRLTRDGAAISRGTIVESGDATTEIDLGGYCRIALEPEGVLRVLGEDFAESVFVDRGALTCEVTPGVGSVEVRSRAGRVTVKGTKFVVRVLGDAGGEEPTRMFVRVIAGVVALGGPGGERLVRAGEQGAVSRAVTPPGLLKLLAETPGGVTVAAGSRAASRRAAGIVRDAIEALPGAKGSVRLVDGAVFDAQECDVTGTTHVIAVGTVWDNPVLHNRMWLSAWWLDRTWYREKYPEPVSPEHALPYMPTEGFIAGGFGEWPGGETRIGYVEVDRSAYFMEWMMRGRFDALKKKRPGEYNGNEYWYAWNNIKTVTSPTYPRDFPLRLVVRVTGSGDEGVLAAAEAFANRGMLSGVVLAKGARPDDAPPMIALPRYRYVTRPPFAPPADVAGYTYQGWLLTDAFQYDGFARDARVHPVVMLRLKYAPPAGITNFWTSPHRQASQFEVCAIKFRNSGDARKGYEALMASLERTRGHRQGRVKGLNAVVVGGKLYVESLPERGEDAGRKVLQAVARAGGDSW